MPRITTIRWPFAFKNTFFSEINYTVGTPWACKTIVRNRIAHRNFFKRTEHYFVEVSRRDSTGTAQRSRPCELVNATFSTPCWKFAIQSIRSWTTAVLCGFSWSPMTFDAGPVSKSYERTKKEKTYNKLRKWMAPFTYHRRVNVLRFVI